jgi:hypothetical protein
VIACFQHGVRDAAAEQGQNGQDLERAYSRSGAGKKANSSDTQRAPAFKLDFPHRNTLRYMEIESF